jgi:hypothetical protein
MHQRNFGSKKAQTFDLSDEPRRRSTSIRSIVWRRDHALKIDYNDRLVADHFHPGSKTPRPIIAPLTLTSSTLPFGKFLTSSGF